MRHFFFANAAAWAAAHVLLAALQTQAFFRARYATSRLVWQETKAREEQLKCRCEVVENIDGVAQAVERRAFDELGAQAARRQLWLLLIKHVVNDPM